MERDMERNSESIQRAFIRLVQGLGLDLGAMDIRGDAVTFETASNASSPRATSTLAFPLEEPLNSGDIPAVQDRFYALLKHRLQSEIQQNPPRFPWEQTALEYRDEVVLAPVMGVDLRSLWLAQLRRLTLPVALPDRVLVQLLEQCQNLAASSLKEGAKLVKAVESLFPEEGVALNQLAGLVMVSPVRGGASLQERLAAETGGDLPTSYDDALPTQQMVLSLLAAREILSALTLTASAKVAPASYEWMTEVGALQLQVEARTDLSALSLRVQVKLPTAGQVELDADGHRAMSERSESGSVTVELTDLQAGQVCDLVVVLGSSDRVVFSIVIEG
jgi:hypothetical protein